MLTDVHLDPTDEQLDAIIEKVKAIANRGKRVTDADLTRLPKGRWAPYGTSKCSASRTSPS